MPSKFRQRRALTRLLLCTLFAINFVDFSSAISVSISPFFIEKVVKAGSTVTDTISYTNRGPEAASVSVEISDFDVGETGEVGEQPAGTKPTSLAPYIRIRPGSLTVAANQQVYFRYSVRTPQEFKQLRAMIFFVSTPQVPEGANQILIAPRMGIPLYVENIDAGRAKLEVQDLRWERSPEKLDFLLLKLVVTNEGERNLRPTGFLEVDSSDGNFHKIFPFNEGQEPVFPSYQRKWNLRFGPVPQNELAIKLRFATSATTTYESKAVIPAVDR